MTGRLEVLCSHLADRAAAAMAELSVIEAQAVLSRVASILPYHDDPEVSSAVARVLVAANKLGQILGLSTGGRTSRVSHRRVVPTRFSTAARQSRHGVFAVSGRADTGARPAGHAIADVWACQEL